MLLLIISLTIQVSAQLLKPFSLKGKLPADQYGYVYLQYQDSKGQSIKDSCTLKNGTFAFKGKIASPTASNLEYKTNSVSLFLEPNNMIFQANTKDFKNSKITGSNTQREQDELNKVLNKFNTRWKVVLDTMTAVAKRSNTAFQELKGWVLVPYFEEQREIYYNFFTKYPASYVTAANLPPFDSELSEDSLKLFYNRFPPAVKKSVFGMEIYKLIENRKHGAINTIAAGFSQQDINGNTISLADFKGKYVLLDFWGSWCVPCRKSHPHLKELYVMYKDKGIEFIGIDTDDKYDAWKKAVSNDGLPWLQISQGDKQDHELSTKYNIIVYPTKILIDKQGKIIGRFGENTEDLNKMMEKIFK